MSNSTAESLRFYARVAGLSYILTMLLGIFGVNFVEANLVVAGNDAATLNNITTKEWLFRLGVASEILMYLLVILLAFSLYVILKSVNRNIALLALLWRTGEAIIGGTTTVLSGVIPVWLLKSGSTFGPEQLPVLTKLFLDVRSGGLDIVLIFIGMGGTLFSYLFFKSGYVPRILALWGILTYLTMLILSFASILTPVSGTVKLIFYAPGGLFELLFGLWLLIKGVQVRQKIPGT